MGTAHHIAPLEAQGGDNVPVLAEPRQQQALLDAMVQTRGSLALACDRLGLSRQSVYRHKLRDPEFAAWVEQAQAQARRMHAEDQLTKVRGHIDSHLDQGWEYQRDADGNLVLDEDFEPIRVRSTISIKSLVDLARESRHAIEGEAGTNIQVNTQVLNKSVQTAPRAVSPASSVLDDVVDAVPVTEDGQKRETE